MVALLRDECEDVREAALAALRAIGPYDVEARSEQLGVMLRHRDFWVRVTVLRAVGDMGVAPGTLLTLVLECLDHEQAGVRNAAAEALSALGPAAQHRAAEVAERLQSPHWEACGVNGSNSSHSKP